MDNKKTFIIESFDSYGDQCFIDSANKDVKSKRSPQGYVEIFEQDINGDKQLVGKSNLVLYKGREWLASRAFNLDNTSIAATNNEFISWFGLGSGGTMAGDPLVPVPPTNNDTDLTAPIMINLTDTACADYQDTGIEETTGYYKHPFDSITFEEDNANDNAFLVCKVITTVEANDANNSLLSEAGLFTSESKLGDFEGPFNIFARITFPTIVKSEDRRLIFVWYIYF